MSEPLTPEGYAATKARLANLEARLAELEKRPDKPAWFSEVRWSYMDMMRQYQRDIKLYEATLARESMPKNPKADETD
jgi:hypothetical protein